MIHNNFHLTTSVCLSVFLLNSASLYTLPDCLWPIEKLNVVCAKANLDVQMITAISGATDITAFSYNSNSGESSNGVTVKLNESYKDVIQHKSIIQLVTT